MSDLLMMCPDPQKGRIRISTQPSEKSDPDLRQSEKRNRNPESDSNILIVSVAAPVCGCRFRYYRHGMATVPISANSSSIHANYFNSCPIGGNSFVNS